ncbi:uncharacterized protein CPUR_08559 [Claviceps purpurea 20.1]|uniref:Uncharacterized protein n=1 Tax=Claviceps purpurea (strain 20.1) TaxID=1111077 RepID=M1WD77_CLAP2|nr:uncharacterized protein CPUR_08559 [Claviceps purpurea 20.1]
MNEALYSSAVRFRSRYQLAPRPSYLDYCILWMDADCELVPNATCKNNWNGGKRPSPLIQTFGNNLPGTHLKIHKSDIRSLNPLPTGKPLKWLEIQWRVTGASVRQQTPKPESKALLIQVATMRSEA